jgi:hypothetical protein
MCGARGFVTKRALLVALAFSATFACGKSVQPLSPDSASGRADVPGEDVRVVAAAGDAGGEVDSVEAADGEGAGNAEDARDGGRDAAPAGADGARADATVATDAADLARSAEDASAVLGADGAGNTPDAARDSRDAGSEVRADAAADLVAAGYPQLCREGGEIKLPDQSRAPEALVWWNDGWVMAAANSTSRISADGSLVAAWTSYADPAAGSVAVPQFAPTATGLLVAYNANPPDSSCYGIKLAKLDAALHVVGGPTAISPPCSWIASLAQDGSAVVWRQGYGSKAEGFFFSLLSPDGALTGATDSWDGQSGTLYASVAKGSLGYLGVSTESRMVAQRYDSSGARMGAQITFPPQNVPDHDRTGTAFAGGNYLVAYAKQEFVGYLGYSVIAEATGSVVRSGTVSQVSAGPGKPSTFDSVVSPNAASYAGRFGITWTATYSSGSNVPRYSFFLLVDADGNQVSAPLVFGERKLVDWPTPSPILAVAPDGFAMLWPRPNTGWVITRIVCD